MFLWQRYRERKRRSRSLRSEVFARHDRLVEQTCAWTGSGLFSLPDDFNLRFEVMVFLVSLQLFAWRQRAQPEDESRIECLWEAMFEGFDHSLRERGVPDMRIGSRMRKLLEHATGRRQAYLEALESRDRDRFHAAIGRNVLNGAPSDDPRIQRLLEEVQAIFPNGNFPEDTKTP
ncbi:MAG: ubiquinol-cytochrome C chaperone family protein [Magnetococcales bacterium]|nr:ubiquinol-cytochrome C chaperone family protein [Magnetococcales bacterium]